MNNSTNKILAYELNALLQWRDELHRAIDFRFDQLLKEGRVIEIPPSANSLTWLKSPDLLIIFYNLLFEHRHIDCSWELFQFHFSNSTASLSKIIFLKPVNHLAYIMDSIQDRGYISVCPHPHIRISQHFLDRFGKPISNTVLRASLDKGIGENSKKFIEKNIFDELKKYNS